MTDRPINFRDFEVRAVMNGRKTQVRRVLKGVPPMLEMNCHPNNEPRHERPYLDSYCGERPAPNNPRGMTDRWLWWQVDDRACLPEFKVPFVPGDRLWVRETWCDFGTKDRGPFGFRADSPDGSSRLRCDAPWRPSIRMPRRASRLTLLVDAVRVERLQDISEEDAWAEGVARFVYDGEGSFYLSDKGTYRCGFAGFWTCLHGLDAWMANPWVAAVTFRVVLGNIDQIEVAQ